MYYCISCSEIHLKKSNNDKIFKNGFYIDPFLGERYHLGMCKNVHDAKTEEVVLPEANTKATPSIMNTLPTHVVPT
ncbi:DUF3973 domain-containing protein [Bacillus cytotoxicus]|uniref:DUF3973 domain-containing protein n=1 Tax=unclassified Bacillus cereus group TaxID=2750818 RepID=UPI001F580C4E|nr:MULTISPECIES: DUF3973 domain-containing protein [unclassified Bacillus cereus group]EMA6342582.1 DUF3973 domain-containing protein [Bacillus cytotoxicus]